MQRWCCVFVNRGAMMATLFRVQLRAPRATMMDALRGLHHVPHAHSVQISSFNSLRPTRSKTLLTFRMANQKALMSTEADLPKTYQQQLNSDDQVRSNPSEVLPAYLIAKDLYKPNADPVFWDEANRLMKEVEAAVKEVGESRFYAKLSKQLRNSPTIQRNISRLLGAHSQLRMVVYSLGTMEFCFESQYQLAIAILLKRDFPHGIDEIEVFDPVLSPVDIIVLEKLGCTVLSTDESCRRRVERPTLFFMPFPFYLQLGNLLDANWHPSRINQIVLLSPELSQTLERHKDCDSEKCKLTTQYLLAIQKNTEEVLIKAKYGTKYDGIFYDFAWHFFDVDSQVDMQTFVLDEPSEEKRRQIVQTLPGWAYDFRHLDELSEKNFMYRFMQNSNDSNEESGDDDSDHRTGKSNNLNEESGDESDSTPDINNLEDSCEKMNSSGTKDESTDEESDEESGDESYSAPDKNNGVDSGVGVNNPDSHETSTKDDAGDRAYWPYNYRVHRCPRWCRTHPQPRPPGWVKLSISGRGYNAENNTPAGFGGIFQNENNEPLAVYCGSLGQEDGEAASIKALRHGLRCMEYMEPVRKLVVVGDNVTAMRWANRFPEPPARLLGGLFEVFAHLTNANAVAYHVHEEANFVAIHLAKRGSMRRPPLPLTWIAPGSSRHK